MNTIGGIIDMDGFKINKKFYCKELGILRMDKEVAVINKITINFPKLSSPSQNFFQLQPPPVRCLSETPEQLKEILAWGT